MMQQRLQPGGGASDDVDHVDAVQIKGVAKAGVVRNGLLQHYLEPPALMAVGGRWQAAGDKDKAKKYKQVSDVV